MTRVFIDQELGLDESVTITGEDAHYLLRVVRVQPGEGLTVVDMVGRAKWEAWDKLKGTASDAAKQQYIDLIEELS